MRHLVTGAAIAIIATLCAAPSAAQNKAGTLNQPRPRTPKIAGQPNFNGIWQSINTANWNLEDHSASALKGFWQLGSIGAIPAGLSVVKGGKIPYLPEAVAQREANQAGWPKADPETLCYLPGIRVRRTCLIRFRSCKAAAIFCSSTSTPAPIASCT